MCIYKQRYEGANKKFSFNEYIYSIEKRILTSDESKFNKNYDTIYKEIFNLSLLINFKNDCFKTKTLSYNKIMKKYR